MEKCVGVCREAREDERCGGLWKSVLGCGGNFRGGIGKCGEVCWGRGEVRRSVGKGVGKCEEVWGELRENEGKSLGVWGRCQVSVKCVKKRWRRCG